MRIVKVDRSRVEDAQRCPRLRYLRYHFGNAGLDSASKPLPLAVGGSVHKGLEVLLREGSARWAEGYDASTDRPLEDMAVAAALADFAQHSSSLELDLTEQATQPVASVTDFASQLGMQAQQLGTDFDAVRMLTERVQDGKQRYDQYLAQEQAALVEAMVRAYCRRRLRPLLEQFVVLEVEREGEWQLSEWHDDSVCHMAEHEHHDRTNCTYSLWFMSRPDALLLERESQQLYILSFKTTSTWDRRKEHAASRDMQGLSEGVEIEKRLAGWWHELRQQSDAFDGQPLTRNVSYAAWAEGKDASEAMYDFLLAQPAPPRILAIRMEFIYKSYRGEDDSLSERFGLAVWSQRSHLVRAYYNPGMTASDAEWCWSWNYLKDDGAESRLNYRTWKSVPVWEHMSMRSWIDMLDDSAMEVSGADSVGMERRELGYKSRAQNVGRTSKHPLDAVFHPPLVFMRGDDDLRDWMEQVEAQEKEVAEKVARVEASQDETERRSLLNEMFPQNRNSCAYPTRCQFDKDKQSVCWGGPEARMDPMGTGLYKARSVNHPSEMEATALNETISRQKAESGTVQAGGRTRTGKRGAEV